MQPDIRTASVRATIEPLDARMLLAGNVSVASNDGELVILGDGRANQILVTQPNKRTLRISGVSGTTINGKQFVKLARPAGDLSIRMTQGGRDRVAIQGPFVVSGDLNADVGKGNLLIEGSSGAVKVTGDLNARTRSAGDVTLRNEVRVGGASTINAANSLNIAAGHAHVPVFNAGAFGSSLEIDNPFYPLVTGTKYTYQAEVIDDETEEVSTEDIVVDVLNETKTILGVESRVVRDRVTEDGLVIEDTFDWFAQDDDGNVWYMGERVTNYEYDDEDNLIGTNDGGSWEAGVNGAQAGIIMEADPRIGFKYYQEFSPGNVLDQAVGVGRRERLETPIGTFTNVYRTREITVAEPDGLAEKLYAPGLGTIQELDFDYEDGEVEQTTRLMSVTLNGQPVTSVVPTTGFEGENADFSRRTGGLRLHGDADLRSKGAASMRGAESHGKVSFTAGDEAVIIDSTFTGRSTLNTGDTLSLSRIFADERIRTGAGTDLYVFDSEIAHLEARFGADDNVLTVKGSTFDIFDADGGAGVNTLEDEGDNDFGRRTLRSFVLA